MLLKRQGRVSYRALKRRFDLDDDYLEDLREVILCVHPVAADKGKGLIWTGKSGTQPGAVYAGLGILEGMKPLNSRLASQCGIRLIVRLGIHTGPVVIGEAGAEVSQEHLALGETRIPTPPPYCVTHCWISNLILLKICALQIFLKIVGII